MSPPERIAQRSHSTTPSSRSADAAESRRCTIASGIFALLRVSQARRRITRVSLLVPAVPNSAASGSASPKGATMQTSRGTERRTADSPHPTGPVAKSPRPRAPDARRTWERTPASSIRRLNSCFSSTSVTVDTGTATSRGLAERRTVAVIRSFRRGRRAAEPASRRRAPPGPRETGLARRGRAACRARLQVIAIVATAPGARDSGDRSSAVAALHETDRRISRFSFASRTESAADDEFRVTADALLPRRPRARRHSLAHVAHAPARRASPSSRVRTPPRSLASSSRSGPARPPAPSPKPNNNRRLFPSPRA